MTGPTSTEERELLRCWVETWRHAGPELERIRRREILALDADATREAIRQLFASPAALKRFPPRTTSGLVEQQMWFSKLHK